MKNLIRPLMFTIARTGLFLAVVVWVVAQWWSVSFLLPLQTGMVGAALAPESWQCRRTAKPINMTFAEIVRTPQSSDSTAVAHEKFRLISQVEYLEELKAQLGTTSITCGISGGEPCSLLPDDTEIFRVETPSPELLPPIDYLALHHSHVATLFLAFNIVLHFIYRKRSEVKPCEV